MMTCGIVNKWLIVNFLLQHSRGLIHLTNCNHKPCTTTCLYVKKSSTTAKSTKKIIVDKFSLSKTENQARYLDYLKDPNAQLVVATGPAGTGKTFLACTTAIKELKKGNFEKIIITRPSVTVDEEHGFLPGNINQKMDPFIRPIFDAFLEYYTKKDIDDMVYEHIIEISPLAYMRGRTLKKAFVIADEMQNSSPNQMKMLTTRIGDGSKMVITGDLGQTDRHINDGISGLLDLTRRYSSYSRINPNASDIIKFVQLNNTDIERSKLTIQMVDMYNYNTDSSGTVVVKPESQHNKPDNDCAIIPKHHLAETYKNRPLGI
jgi:phosphate starvation-inducible PhoH-like protein